LSTRPSGKRGAFLVLTLATLASFACAAILGQLAPSLFGKLTQPANFYLLPSRFWELGIGGLAMLAQPWLVRMVGEGTRRILASAGIVATLGSLALLGSQPSMPGFLTLVPTTGTALFLIFGDTKGVGALLSASPARWLGLISYSVYLYHQPVFAFLRIASLHEPSWQLMTASIMPTLVLGWLSWRFVERPFRDHKTMSTSRVLRFSIGGTFLGIVAGLVIYLTSGFHSRWPELAEGDPLFGANQNAVYVEGPMALAGKPFATADKQRNVLVVGDSFARDFLNMAKETGSLKDYSVSYLYGNICLDPALRAKVLERAYEADHVVVSTWFRAPEIPCLAAIVQDLKKAGTGNVVVLGTKNFGFNNNAIMHLPADRRYQWRVHPLAELEAENRAAAAAIPAPNYLNVLSLLDDGTATVPVFTPERKFISQDRRHLTRAGARYVGSIVFAQPQFAWTRTGRLEANKAKHR
jgi:hypothetical protein